MAPNHESAWISLNNDALNNPTTTVEDGYKIHLIGIL